MNLMILHLSDLHIKLDTDPVLERGGKIVDAVKNLHPRPDLVLVTVTGDIAFSGREDEYALAAKFLRTICDGLRIKLADEPKPAPPVRLILVPGNHDCEHPEEATRGLPSARHLIIAKAREDPCLARESTIVDVCTAVQASFFSLLQNEAADGRVQERGAHDERLSYEYRFNVGQESVQIVCCNTAWLSRKNEVQGELLFPPDAVPARPPDATLVIGMLHHPYNWLDHNSARALRKRLEATTDILLTGHEHDATFHQQEGGLGERNIYVEGGVLQESGGPSSSFNVILVNTTAREQAFLSLVWGEGRYDPQPTDFDPLTNDLRWRPYQMGSLRRSGSFEVSKEWSDYLEDLGVNLFHGRRGKPRLSDVYVHPDLRESGYLGRPQQREELPSSRVINGIELPDLLERQKHIVITGDAQSGKSSFCKTLFKRLIERGYVPVLIRGHGRMPDPASIGRYLDSKFIEQYDPSNLSAFQELDRDRKVLIFDDYHRLRMRPKEKRRVIEQLREVAGHLIIVSDDHALKTEDLLDPSAETLLAFARYDVMPFGHVKQEELIGKWLALDADVETEAVELARRIVALHDTFTTVVGKNFVPSFPIYLLAILQSDTTIDTRASTHGYFYELFIRNALARDRTRFEFDVVQGYLSDLAHHMFTERLTEIDSCALADFHKQYESRYDIRRPFPHIVDQLTGQHILTVRDGIYRFKYDYLYYYFTAKFIANHLQDQSSRDHVAAMSRSLHIEEFANIMLFLAHISKDPIIVGEMVSAAEALYKDKTAANMQGDVEFLNYPAGGVDVPVYRDRRPEEVRREINEARDRQNNTKAGDDSTALDPAPIAAPEKELDDRSTREAADKTLRILGQIVKNFPGTMEKDEKLRITKTCYLLGLRGLSWFLELLRNHRDTFIGIFAETLKDGGPTLSEEECRRRAGHLLFHIGWILSYIHISRIASAVGSPDLTGTYETLQRELNCTATDLINIALQLEQTGQPPIVKLRELGKSLRDNNAALWVLRILAIVNLYMFGPEYDTKQAVCAAVGIRFERFSTMASTMRPLVKQAGGSGS
jgi:hypothetical protein